MSHFLRFLSLFFVVTGRIPARTLIFTIFFNGLALTFSGQGSAQPLQITPVPSGPAPSVTTPPKSSTPSVLKPSSKRPAQAKGTEQFQEPEPETPKNPNPVAIFAGLDKITGRIISFDVQVDETVQFGALQVTPRICYTRPATETPKTTSFVEVDEITLDNKIRRIFSGWMFAASPGLNAVEHPIYDIWLTGCKGNEPEIPLRTDTETPPAEPAPAQKTKEQPKDNKARKRL